MKRSSSSDEQIIAILKEQQTGMPKEEAWYIAVWLSALRYFTSRKPNTDTIFLLTLRLLSCCLIQLLFRSLRGDLK
jgi:hypothetical protein